MLVHAHTRVRGPDLRSGCQRLIVVLCRRDGELSRIEPFLAFGEAVRISLRMSLFEQNVLLITAVATNSVVSPKLLFRTGTRRDQGDAMFCGMFVPRQG